jgi:microcin C transport system ATP-binding protein
VVDSLSLQIEAGETLALVGESGSGKSVSALSILRLLPTPPAVYPQGDILFHGESLLHASEKTLRQVRGNKIAMIFRNRWCRSTHCIAWKSSSMRSYRYTGGCAKRPPAPRS